MTSSAISAFLRTVAMAAALATTVGLAAHPGHAWAADPLTDGRRALAAGKWDKAEKKLRKALRGPTHAESGLLLADLLLLRGRTDEAAELAAKALVRSETASAGAALLGRAELLRGRPKQAIKVLKKALKADAQAHQVQILLAQALIEVGDPRGARSLLEPLVRADDRGAYRTADDLTALGQAARLLGRTRFAFQALDEATQAAPKSPEPFIALGLTALDVGDTINAESAFKQALVVRPDDPRALVGLAAIELDVARTYDDAMALLDKAEAIHPDMPEAQRLRAKAEILGERPDAALVRLDKLVKAHPHDLQARSLVAAAQDALGDDKAFEKTVRAILRQRRRYAEVFTTVAWFAERSNRYHRAIALAKRALKTNPDHWLAHAILGVQYTRTGAPGDEDKGRRHLERYYERDDYNVRVTNLLNLYERWIGDYVWVDDPDIRIRVHRSERAIAERVILPFAKEMLARYDKRYGYKPARPVVLELFHKPNLFALRSVGLPGVASHGLCFGRLVTARSPSSGDFNWGMVVAHELAHVYGLGMSEHRVPRWFTEGLAEYETNVLRPEWTRHHGQELHNALQSGRIPGILDLSRAFTQAKSLGEVVVAYQQSALVVHHLVETAGYDAVVKAHRRFRKGERLDKVIQAITGLSTADFDRRFTDWLRTRTARYAKNWDLDKALYRDGDALRDAVRAKPTDADARAALAAHFLTHKNLGAALLQAKRTLATSPRHPLASFVAAQGLIARNEHAEAKPLLEAMIEDGHDGYVVRRSLVDVALAEGDAEAAEMHMRVAQALDPQKTLPRSGLARLLIKFDRDSEAVEHLEKWAMLNMNDPEPSRTLADAAGNRGDTEAELRWAEHLRFIAPYDPLTHLFEAHAYDALGKRERARAAVQTALVSVDPEEFKAMLGLARTLAKRGWRKEALTTLERAILLRPDDIEARALHKQLSRSSDKQ